MQAQPYRKGQDRPHGPALAAMLRGRDAQGGSGGADLRRALARGGMKRRARGGSLADAIARRAVDRA